MQTTLMRSPLLAAYVMIVERENIIVNDQMKRLAEKFSNECLIKIQPTTMFIWKPFDLHGYEGHAAKSLIRGNEESFFEEKIQNIFFDPKIRIKITGRLIEWEGGGPGAFGVVFIAPSDEETFMKIKKFTEEVGLEAFLVTS